MVFLKKHQSLELYLFTGTIELTYKMERVGTIWEKD